MPPMDNADALPAMTVMGRSEALDDFDSLMRAHQQHVYRVLVSLVRDPDAADTLTQECFLRAYQKRDSFRGEAGVRTWLMTIAVNLARDYGRNRRMGFWRRLFRSEDPVAVADSVSDGRPDAERSLIARQELGAVWSALDRLSEGQRTVFVLRFVDDLSLDQIATATGTTIGTVKTQLFRAIAALRRETGREK
ncbi:MAG: RNA polymerase sigma factor [Terriglobales bacterium]